MRASIGLCFLVLMGLYTPIRAQSDSLGLHQQADSSVADTTKSRWPVPNRAALYSLILPGAGQIYNRDWWKVPLVWGGVGAAGYFIVYNHREFTRYRQLTETTEEPLRLQYRALRDYHRRNRDFTILLTALGYALVAVEAYVDAHLYYFDVSDNLSMALKPGLMAAGPARAVPALGIQIRLGPH
ncbi:MAG: hypothetical protein KF690_00375 [Bacteroidetes bacterium]|nr:hypothetical protein [Bacteroidota bacterium]